MASLTCTSRCAGLTRPAAMTRVARVYQPRMVMVRSIPMKDIEAVDAKVEEAIHEAEEVCAKGDVKQCAVAWDNVEELSAAAAHKKVAYNSDPVNVDPLEAFCDDNPDADECRIYED